MSNALWFLLAILVISAIYAIVLIREYLNVTKKRREFIASLGGSGRAVPRFKHTLMSTYVIGTVLWTIGLGISFFVIV